MVFRSAEYRAAVFRGEPWRYEVDDPLTITLDRLTGEEGFRAQKYTDTAGHLTIGYGFNIDAGVSQGLAAAILLYQLGDTLKQIQSAPWWPADDPVRASVLLDVAFNAGVAGLLHFPKMLAAVGARDWVTASAQLLDSDAARALPNRYNPLAELLLNGS
jgi:lysozyme